MPRVLFWSDLFPPYWGGAERWGGMLVPRLAQRGVVLEVVTSHDHLDLPDEDRMSEVPVHRMGFIGALHRRDPVAIVRLCREVEALADRFQPDLVHVFSPGPSVLFCLRARLNERAPLLVTLQNEALDATARHSESMVRSMWQCATWVTAPSKRILAEATRVNGGLVDKSGVVRNGIEPPAGPATPARRSPPHVVGIGRFVEQKGFDIALDAFATLAARFPDCRFTLAGDGPDREFLKRRATELGIADRVGFPGLLDSAGVYALLDAATVVVMPSRWDGLPLLPIEAAFRRRAMVASEVGGVPDVVIDGVTGLLVPPNDPVALADRVAELLRDLDRADTLAAAAHDRAQREFTIDRCAGDYAALYARLIQRSTVPVT